MNVKDKLMASGMDEKEAERIAALLAEEPPAPEEPEETPPEPEETAPGNR